MRKQLGQGRGSGFLAAVDAGERAAGCVVACVLEDPRWDRQVEHRAAYYAQLLAKTRAGLQPIEARVLNAHDEPDDSGLWLPIEVLAELARRRSEDADRALRRAVAESPVWRMCLDALDAAGGEALLEHVVNTHALHGLLAHVDRDDLVDAVKAVGAPWERWAERVPGLRFATPPRNDASARPLAGPAAWLGKSLRMPDVPRNLAALVTERLLDEASVPGLSSKIVDVLTNRTDVATTRTLRVAVDSEDPRRKEVALRTLARWGCTDFLESAEAFFREESQRPSEERNAHGLRRAFLRYVEELPASATLALARSWFSQPWPLSLAAEHILARHASDEDRQMLEGAGQKALGENDMYRLCSIVDALSASGSGPSIGFLAEAYAEAPYSYARRRVVAAMTKCALSPTTEALLTEALWDCEAESRQLAAAQARQLSAVPLSRLQELAGDPYEDEEVRRVAASSRRLDFDPN